MAEKKQATAPPNGAVPLLKQRYQEQVVPALIKRFGYKNAMQVPRIVKVAVNMGVGDAKEDAKRLDAAVNELSLITGQRPSIRRAKKSIANFRVRQGNPIGCAVTLRGNRMWDFLLRLIVAALPRIRDFQGLSPDAFDGRGNYTIGVREQLIFPEINYDKIIASGGRVRGMDITIVTSAQTDEEARALLTEIGFPMRES
ncbi:MAG: 50S ribosomal protein L5 [Abditibacteriales bacterium]|nr:50S ribosomal protein L5 [Abditibacteriales bacterium]MDW8364992.1 50S ribosomal protein L5 [Abditibacteriales bacterium]